MPELPEVQTICDSLQRQLAGIRIDHVLLAGKLRKTVALPELDAFCRGKSISAVTRRAKYILVHFTDQSGLILHLGMTGCFIIDSDNGQALKHERVSWLLSDGRRWRFCDARGFGSLQLFPQGTDFSRHPSLAGLGIEPLSENFTGQYLKTLCRQRKTSVKPMIMDQTHVVGVGNIYASEALFRCGISPKKPAYRLTLRQCEQLVASIKEVLLAAIAAGGSSIRDFHHIDGSEGHFKVQLRVYGRTGQPCPECSAEIRRIVQGGRSSFFCPKCQRG